MILLPLICHSEDRIEGNWVTIDDDGKTEKSLVELQVNDGVLTGRVVELINPDPEKPKTCEKCKGERKDQTIEGMQILRDMQFENGKWRNGKILDPSTGKEYSCVMELQDNGDRLKVRGFIGFSLLGRTQYWHRKTQQ